LSTVLLALTVALAAVGALLAARSWTSQAAHGVGSPGDIVRHRTSFGSLEVSPLVVLAAPDPKAMFGMPPGASHDEHSGKATVQVPVTLSNTSDKAVAYSLDSFRLLSASDREGARDERLDGPQQLRPGSAISLRLTFFTDAATGTTLRYQPPSGSAIEVPLAGVPGTAGAGAHSHH
jgi:hypothetical protein